MSESNVRTSRRLRWASILVRAAVASLVAATLFAYLGEHGWFFDAFSHFRWHYMLAALVLAPLAFVRAPRWLALAAVLAGAAHLPAVIAAPDRAPVAAAGAPVTLKIMTFNVWWRSDRLDGLLGRVKAAEPDIVVLEEVHGQWHAAVERLRARQYPHVAPADWRNSGIVVLSRYPIVDSRRGDFVVYADIALDGRRIRVAGVHMPLPLSAPRWQLQRVAFADLARAARDARMPFIAAGDFNLTPDSPRFPEFLAASGLKRAALGGIWPNTWPAPSGWKYGGPLTRGFAIDHVLVSRDFAIAGIHRGPDIGSDHYPIHVHLALPK
jgi:endonuclease/exonuclease/phosphatase (EEP) superfamily protein YafD